MAKIALLTYYRPTVDENYQELADVIIPGRNEYCEKHGYEHWIYGGVYRDVNMYYAYERLIYLRDKLNERPDIEYVFVANIQSLITNFNIKIESIIDPWHDFWVSKDINFINCGVMIFKNCQWTKEWLDFLISKEPEYRGDCWKEQRCIINHWSSPRWVHRINLLPQKLFNAYQYERYDWPKTTNGQWEKGDFILSLPGLNLAQRLEIVKDILNKDVIVK